MFGLPMIATIIITGMSVSLKHVSERGYNSHYAEKPDCQQLFCAFGLEQLN